MDQQHHRTRKAGPSYVPQPRPRFIHPPRKTARTAAAGAASPIESLEDRRLMAATVSVVGRELRVVGDAQQRNRLSVDLRGSAVVVTANGVQRSFARSALASVSITGGAADDWIEVAKALTLPATIRGGGSYDVIQGGGGPDTVYGGPGPDSITGRGGRDVMYGEDGDDWISGTAGLDTAFGGPGNDKVVGLPDSTAPAARPPDDGPWPAPPELQPARPPDFALADTLVRQSIARRPPAPPAGREPWNQPAGRVVSWITVGGSGFGTRANRYVGWGANATHRKQGWAGYIRRVIQPQIAWGARRFALHNPFGVLIGQSMQFDQFLHARDGVAGAHNPLPWLYQDFVSAWSSLIRAQAAKGQPIEVIAYLGRLDGDPDFARLDPQEWAKRFSDSVRMPVEAGMSVGFDASSFTPADSPTFRAADLLRRDGVRVYTEARPRLDAPQWWDFPVISENNFWFRSDPARWPDSKRWAAPTNRLSGEILRIVQPANPNDWLKPGFGKKAALQILRDGNVAAVALDPIIQQGVKLRDLIAAV